MINIKNEEIDQNKLEKKYETFSNKEKEMVHRLYHEKPKEFKELKNLIELLIFYKKPPTPEEFLDSKNKYLPADYINGLYPYIKEDFIKAMRKDNPYSIISFYGSTRCEAKNTPILMYDLSIKMIQDIRVGDILMGDDGTPRNVLETTKGFGKLYEIQQNKADNYIVNENHVLVLQYTNKGLRKDRNNAIDKNNGKTIEISIKDYLKLSKNKKHRLKGIKSPGFDFPYQKIPLDSYFLGVWLADGTSKSTEITTPDKEIKEYIYEYANKLKLQVSTYQNNTSKAIRYSIKGTTSANQFSHNDNIVFYALKNLNLLKNKHIPDIYIKNSKKVRLQLLAGLLDGGGYKSKGCYEIIQKNTKLANQIVLLARTLGFKVSIKKVKKGIKKLNFIGEYNLISISGNLFTIPLKIKRKKFLKNYKPRNNVLRTGIKVKELEKKGEFFGFALDGNQKYLHSDFTITHNTGKTVLARLFTLYSIIFVNYLRDPHTYFKINKMSKICIYLVSFKSDKTKQVYLSPLLNLLDASEMFIRERFEQNVYKKGIDLEGKIHFSEASKFGDITFPTMSIVTGKDASSLVGADIVAGAVSELTFFKEYAKGMTDEQIVQVFTKLYTRIQNTVGFGTFPCWSYIDSSANEADSPIENMILKDLKKDPHTFFRHYVLWEVRPHLFPEYERTGKTFPICSGDGAYKAKILYTDQDIEKIPSHLKIDIPIDLKDTFERNLIDSIKDVAGRGTSKENKLIPNISIITELFNNITLNNIEGLIIADSKDLPENLLWNQIYEKFFIKIDNNRLLFRRAQLEPRFLGVDLAYSLKGDIIGLTMLHKEWSKELNRVLYVSDFSFVVGPGKNEINLNAISCFIEDLIVKGGISFSGIYVDQFQSAELRQYTKRLEINTYLQSVDKELSPYLFFVVCLNNGTVKSGKNVFLKNNLKSLIRTKNKSGKEIIDHTSGTTNNDYLGNFEKSYCGINGKDCSDSFCQALWGAKNDDILPSICYEDENKRLSNKKEDINKNVEKAINKLHKYF